MADPDWYTRALAEGRILSEVGANAGALGGNVASRVVGVEPTEAEFQAQVIDLARSRGWRVAHFRKVRVQRASGKTYWETPVAADGKGFPDLIMLRRGVQVVAELKVGKNTTSAEQREWLADFARAGSLMFVWKPADWPEIVKVLAAPGAAG
jgi:hypothetical protein